MSKSLTQCTKEELLALLRDKDTPDDVFKRAKLEVQKRIDRRNLRPHDPDCLCHECQRGEK